VKEDKMPRGISYVPWPELPYRDFAATARLLHMGLQAIGKLKLAEPSEPRWAEVILYVTSRGLSTGPIPYQTAAYSVDVDFVSHHIACTTSWGQAASFPLGPMPVSDVVAQLFAILGEAGVDAKINMRPQEITDPIPFDLDTQPRPYEAALANAWWRILLSTQQVLAQYHGRFLGRTPPIGLMWGTIDLRDARYNGKPASPGPKADFIRRNAMNEEQIEAGWWHGTDAYPRAAFYAFTHPKPDGIEHARIQPSAGRWDAGLGEFLLDYDDLRLSKDPGADLLAFFESTYQAGAKLAGWDPQLAAAGKPE
jgi:hypothetical protein